MAQSVNCRCDVLPFVNCPHQCVCCQRRRPDTKCQPHVDCQNSCTLLDWQRNQQSALNGACVNLWSNVCFTCWVGALFTKYLTTISRSSYDGAKITINLRRTSNLRNILQRTQGFFLGMIHLQNCKIVWDSVGKLAYDISNRNLSMLEVTIVGQSYDKLEITLR